MSGARRSVGVFTTDRELVVKSWDPWLADATGITEAAACGRPLAELFPELGERGVLPRLQRVAAEGVVEVLAPAFHRYLVPCAPREPSAHFTRMQQHVTLSPLRGDGEVVGVVVTVEDVTARLDRERELAKALTSQDEAIRLRAAQVLAEDDGPAAVLAEALADRSWRVRRIAAQGLAHGRGEEAVSALVEAVRERHRDPSVLNAALTALNQSDQDVVPPVVALLAAPDADVRTYAALALGQLDDPRAVPALLRALEDADANVRYHAVEALGRLRAREAAQPVAAVAESRDFYLAFAALDALAAIGEPSVASRLLPLLDDDLLREAAAGALGRLGSEEVIAPLAALLDHPETSAAAVASALATLYRRFEESYAAGALVADLARGAMTPQTGQRLIAALPRADDAELDALVLVLGWIDFPGVDRALARLLAHDGVRRTAAAALSRRGAAAVDAVLEALATDDDEVRKSAAMVLGRIGSPRAVPALLTVLDAAPDVAVAAAGALGGIGDRRAFEPLLSLFERTEAAVRQAAVSALNSIGHPDMPARVEALLAHPSPRVRESAAKIAGYFGYGRCLEPLLRLCGDPEEVVRRAAVEHLVYLDDPRAAAAVAQALEAETPGVRAAAARALAQVPAESALPGLLAACRDPDPWVRYYAARSAGQHRYPDAIATLGELAHGDPVPPVRIAAVDALGEIGTPATLAAVAPLAEDADPAVARAALAALGRIADPAAVPPLIASLGSGDPERLLAALGALGRRGAAESVPAVERIARAEGDARARDLAVEVLAQIGGEDAVAALIALAANPRRGPSVTAALARLGEEQLVWVGRGLHHPDEGVRCAVVEALARMRHQSARRLLAGALGDGAATVRLAATRALGRMDLRSAEPTLSVLARTDRSEAVRHAAESALSR
jgi:HEAT repeat protein